MGRGLTKVERLQEMIWLYLQRGYSDIEMADRLGVNRTTVFRDRIELAVDHAIYQDADGRYRMNRMQYMPHVKVNLHEALTLYLAARRASRQTRIAQPHAASALEKLAVALKQPMTERLVRSAEDILRQEADPGRVHVLEEITQGWAENRKVRILYQALRARTTREHIVCPYLIEPSLWTDGIYLIGYSEARAGITTFKVERIEEAQLKLERFELPEGFNEEELLRYAWGIWSSEGEPELVRLKFTPGTAARRMRESKWHPTEKVTALEDGGLIWEARVAEWQEMVPWVKSWGADVEVLEPEGLREVIKRDAKELALQYQFSTPTGIPVHQRFWAKADKKSENCHLLLYHMIDVGNTALVLWQTGINNNLRNKIAEWLDLSIDDTGKLIAFWASLHDLGKASPSFQDHPYLPAKLRDRIRRELEALGLNIPSRSDGEKRARHESITTSALMDDKLLAENTILPAWLVYSVAQVLGGHHGAWPHALLLSPPQLKPLDKGDDQWSQARRELVRDLQKIFLPPEVRHFEPNTLRDNVVLTLISGLISVADWLGSNEDYFPHEWNNLPIDSYVCHSRQHAQYALLKVNWENSPPIPDLGFEEIFGFAPTQEQTQVIDVLKQIPLPAVAIIEAPMGSGKTEAALSVYTQWARASGNSGLYVAMPTTATSNQMHARVASFLSTQFGKNVEPMLVHGQALLQDAPPETDAVENPEENNCSDKQAWFLPRKKSMLVPFGVGTVDQAFMSILQTKHFFVRLFGLSHKVVIFDEVHAYDAYMSELFERLLIWLRQLNVSVIVLSATLPDKTRQHILSAYSGKTAVAPYKKYPRLTFTGLNGRPNAIGLPQPKEKKLLFDWVNRDEACIVKELSNQLWEGGCAVVICNTVTRAQNLYELLHNREEKICEDDNLILFHARYPLAWRDEIERDVLSRFGPGKDKSKVNPDRPSKAIVIATQVVEQSLDLDFDVMISDFAPIDLLLQRVGRLHRHAVNDFTRKHPYRLLITEPEMSGDKPRFDRGDAYVYDEYVLLRSWIVLRKIVLRQISLPTDLPVLIEKVYGDAEPTDEPSLLEVLAKTKEKMTEDELGMKYKARKCMIARPEDEDLLFSDSALLEEDDPTVHETFQALTRADRPGINVVCLHQVNGQLLLDPDDPIAAFDPSQKMNKIMVRELARHAVNVRHFDPAVERYLINKPEGGQAKVILEKWKKVAALRYHRVAIFEDGICHLKGTGYRMCLNKKDKLGLRIK